MQKVRSIVLTIVRVAVAVGLILYLAMSGAIKLSSLSAMIASLHLTVLAAAFFFTEVVLTAWRLTVLLKAYGIKISMKISYQLTMIGLFFNTTLPGATGGDLVKIYYATRGQHGSKTEVTTVILLDRVIGMLGLMMWPLLVAPFFLSQLASNRILLLLLFFAAGASAFIILVLFIAFTERMYSSALLKWAYDNFPLGHHLERVMHTIHSFRQKKRAILNCIGISLLVHTANVIVVVLISFILSSSSFNLIVVILAPLGLIANALPLTPGGLGVGEAAFDKLFAMVNLNFGAEVLLSWRILMVLIGLIGLFYYLKGKKEYIPRYSTMSDAK